MQPRRWNPTSKTRANKPTPLKNFFQRITGSSPGGGANRKFTAILVCVVAAIAFWFLIALSKDYSARLVMPVIYQNFPGQKVVMNELPASLSLTVKTSGFSILSFDFGKERQQLIVDVASLLSTQSAERLNGVVAVSTNELTAEIIRQLGENVSITTIAPDSLVFSFGSRVTKKVPVKVDAALSFERQFDSLGIYSVMPNEVEIAGPESVITGITYVETEPAVYANAKADIKLKLKLKLPAYVESTISEVLFFVPVEKFTEGSMEVPVLAANVRSDYELKSFPDKVKVRFLVPVSKYSLVKPDKFNVMVDASEASAANGNRLRVHVLSQPGYVRFVTSEPERVEFILRKK